MAVLSPCWFSELPPGVFVTAIVKKGKTCVITFNVLATSLSQETRKDIAKSVKSCAMHLCKATPTHEGFFKVIIQWNNPYTRHPIPNLTFSATLHVLRERGIAVTRIAFRNLEANIYCGKESKLVSDDDRGAIANALRSENPTLQEMFLTLEGALTINIRFPRPNYDDPLYQ
jgi:hypothetical protein